MTTLNLDSSIIERLDRLADADRIAGALETSVTELSGALLRRYLELAATDEFSSEEHPQANATVIAQTAIFLMQGAITATRNAMEFSDERFAETMHNLLKMTLESYDEGAPRES